MRALTRRAACAALTASVATAVLSTAMSGKVAAAFLPGSGALFNVDAFGAIGNGASNPASLYFPSLAALQAKYSFATALTNEMDWLATQAAINACRARVTGGGLNGSVGGVVYLPAAVYVFSNANSAGDGSGMLTLPQTTPFFPSGQAVVHLVGDGEEGSVLSWPVSTGAGSFGVLSANRAAGAGNFSLVRGLSFVGPGPIYNLSRIGTRVASSMTGFGKGNAQHFEHCTFEQWDVGLDFVGGQDAMLDCRFENNFYHLYWSAPNTAGLIGDTKFDRLLMQNALGACIGVHHAACITDCKFEKCTFDYAPWGIFKETNGGSPANAQLLNFCNFDHTQFESMGNGAIGDDRLTAGQGAPACVTSVYQTRFVESFFSWLSSGAGSVANAAYGSYAPFAAYDWNLTEFDGGLATFTPGTATPGGTAGVFLIKNGGANGLRLMGDIAGLITVIKTAPAAAQYLLAGDSLALATVINTSGFQWEGYAVSQTATIGLSTGQVVNAVPSTYGNITVGNATGGATSDAPAGVVMQVGGGEGVAGGTPFGANAIVATRGFVTVNATGNFATGNVTTPVWLRTAAGGKVTPATNANDSTTPMVGTLAGVPGTTTPASVLIRLRGLG